jgi:gluconate 2-dehydrogenase gamma chain
VRASPHRSGISRRQLLRGGAAALGGAALAGGLAGCGSGEEEAAGDGPLEALSEREAAIVSAMADRVFPPGDGAPGATAIGVVAYLDRQLAGGWGSGDRFYAHGPFPEPTDSGHGYQLPLTPRELYRRVLPRIDEEARRRHGSGFAELEPARQDDLMTALEEGRVDLGLADGRHGFGSGQFFAIFLQNVREGLFADPLYGGNRDVEGWRWIGYPGDPMAYGDVYYAVFDDWDVRWDVEPRGLSGAHGGGGAAAGGIDGHGSHD